MEPADLYVAGGRAMARMRTVSVRDQAGDWYELGGGVDQALDRLDVVLMRRDPPFDMDYVYLTYALELAERAGTLVVNRPQALRDANEKFFITQFPQCCAPFTITRSSARILELCAGAWQVGGQATGRYGRRIHLSAQPG